MAFHKLQFYPSTSDLGLYAIFRSMTDGDVWNGTTMVPWVDLNIGLYDVATTFLGGDAYGLTIPTALPSGDDYTATFYKPTVIGTPSISDAKLPDEWKFRWTGVIDIDPGEPGDPTWHYADYTAVKDILGLADLSIVADPRNGLTEDMSLIQRCGEYSDAVIDAKFATFGFTTPLASTSAATDLILRDISAKLTIAQLNRSRALVVVTRAGQTGQQVAGVDKQIGTWERESWHMLTSLASGRMGLTADRTSAGPSVPVPAFTTSFTYPYYYYG